VFNADAIIELCAVIALVAYGVTFRTGHATQYLHRCLAALFISLGVLFLARSVNSLTGAAVFAHLATAASLFLPLMVLLCAEAIRREHAPWPAKLIAAVGPVALLAWRLLETDRTSLPGTVAREVFVLGGLLGSALWIWRCPPVRLPGEERRFAQFFVIAMLIAVPFAATDFQNFLELPVRMGALGVLIGIHIAVWVPASGMRFRFVLAQLCGAFAFAAILIASGWPWFDDHGWPFLVRAWAAVSGVLLAAGIALKLTADFVRRRSNRFLEQFLACDMRGVDSFLGTAAMLAPFSGMLILGGESLADYDCVALVKELSRGKVVALGALKRRHQPTPTEEQMIDILEQSGATHLCLASTSPLRLALFTAGPLADAREVGAQIELFARTTEFLERRGQHADAA
jgi:hypothetical protein